MLAGGALISWELLETEELKIEAGRISGNLAADQTRRIRRSLHTNKALIRSEKYFLRRLRCCGGEPVDADHVRRIKACGDELRKRVIYRIGADDATWNDAQRGLRQDYVRCLDKACSNPQFRKDVDERASQ